MDYAAHNARMVDHFLWLETHAPKGYARGAVVTYSTQPFCPNPDILADVTAEKSRRASHAPTSSPANPSK